MNITNPELIAILKEVGIDLSKPSAVKLGAFSAMEYAWLLEKAGYRWQVSITQGPGLPMLYTDIASLIWWDEASASKEMRVVPAELLVTFRNHVEESDEEAYGDRVLDADERWERESSL